MKDNIFWQPPPRDFSGFIEDPLDMDTYLKRRRHLSVLSPEPYDEEGEVNTNRIPVAPNEYTNRSELYGMLQKSSEDLDVLREHLGKAPTRKPESTGRSIATALLAGAAGFTGGVGRGMEVASTIRDSGYNKELMEWKQKAAGLEDIANLSSQKSRILGTIEDYRQRDSDRDEDRKRKVQEEENRHAERLAKIQEERDDNERQRLRDEEIARHNKEVEANQRARTSAYSRSVTDRGKRLGDIGDVKISERRQAERDALHEVVGSDPRFRKFANYGNYNNPYAAKDDPEEQRDFQIFLIKVQQVAKRILAERQGREIVPPMEEDDFEFEP